VEILSDKKLSNTQRSGELRILFKPVVPDEFIFENSGRLNKGFTGYLKGSAGNQVTRNVQGQKVS
jgi:hypothetical protein